MPGITPIQRIREKPRKCNLCNRLLPGPLGEATYVTKEPGYVRSRANKKLKPRRTRLVYLAALALFGRAGVEIRDALEKITDERHANNVSVASIIREAKVLTKVPTEAKRPEAVLASGR